MERVAMDILGPLPESTLGNKYILVVTDYFTRWTECYAMPDYEAITVVKLFVNQFLFDTEYHEKCIPSKVASLNPNFFRVFVKCYTLTKHEHHPIMLRVMAW